MSENKRNIDKPDLDYAKTPDGNRHPTGQGTHEKHRVENEAQARDNKAVGTAARKGDQTGGR